MKNSKNLFNPNSSATSSKNSEHNSEAHNFLKKRSNLKYDPMESAKQAKQRKISKNSDSIGRTDENQYEHINDISEPEMRDDVLQINRNTQSQNEEKNELKEGGEIQNLKNPRPKYQSCNKINRILNKNDNHLGKFTFICYS